MISIMVIAFSKGNLKPIRLTPHAISAKKVITMKIIISGNFFRPLFYRFFHVPVIAAEYSGNLPDHKND